MQLQDEPRPDPAPAWRRWARLLAPWTIAAATVAALAHSYSLPRIVEELRHARSWPLLPLALGMEIVSLLLLSAADALVIGGLLHGPSPVDLVRARAASALLEIIGYAVGRAGYGVWIARRSDAGAAAAVGIVLYLVAADFAALCLVASGSALLGGASVPPLIRIVAPALAAVMILAMVVGPRLPVANVRWLAPWTRLSAGRALAQLGLRAMQISTYAASTWLAARAFGLSLPAWSVAAYLPIALLVESLPINVAGFGAVQAVWLLFTPELASGERILAFHFSWQVSIVLAVALLGSLALRRYLAQIEAGSAAAPPGCGSDPEQNRISGL